VTIRCVFRQAEVKSTGGQADFVQKFDLTQARGIVDPALALGSRTAGLGFPKKVICCRERLNTGSHSQCSNLALLWPSERVPERSIMENARPSLKAAGHKSLAVSVQIDPGKRRAIE